MSDQRKSDAEANVPAQGTTPTKSFVYRKPGMKAGINWSEVPDLWTETPTMLAKRYGVTMGVVYKARSTHSRARKALEILPARSNPEVQP